MPQSSKLDRAISLTLTIATVIALGLLVERRIVPRTTETGADRVVYLKDWRREIDAIDTPIGDTTGVVTVAVLTDFECPYCSRMDSLLSALELQNPGKIARTVVHFPLSGHQQAKPAAIVFECANEQQRAQQMHHLLYADQESLGRTPWADFAI